MHRVIIDLAQNNAACHYMHLLSRCGCVSVFLLFLWFFKLCWITMAPSDGKSPFLSSLNILWPFWRTYWGLFGLFQTKDKVLLHVLANSEWRTPSCAAGVYLSCDLWRVRQGRQGHFCFSIGATRLKADMGAVIVQGKGVFFILSNVNELISCSPKDGDISLARCIAPS